MVTGRACGVVGRGAWRAKVLPGAAGLLVVGAIACGKAGAGDGKQEGSGAPELADDALIGSCQAKDGSFCDEYRNKKGQKAAERDVEITLTKGACDSDLKNGTWREGKACEPKGEIGHCLVDKASQMKRVAYSFKGDEEMTAIGCTDLYQGKWESGLADDAVLASCVVGTSCYEIRNKKSVPADSRARSLTRESESCDRLEGTFEKGKACDASKARARCTKKGDNSLTTVRIESDGAKQSIADAKELCALGDPGVFEALDAKK